MEHGRCSINRTCHFGSATPTEAEFVTVAQLKAKKKKRPKSYLDSTFGSRISSFQSLSYLVCKIGMKISAPTSMLVGINQLYA